MARLKGAGVDDVGYGVGNAPRTSGLNAVMDLSLDPEVVDRAPTSLNPQLSTVTVPPPWLRNGKRSSKSNPIVLVLFNSDNHAIGFMKLPERLRLPLKKLTACFCSKNPYSTSYKCAAIPMY